MVSVLVFSTSSCTNNSKESKNKVLSTDTNSALLGTVETEPYDSILPDSTYPPAIGNHFGTPITLRFKNDSVHFKDGDEVLTSVYLKPKSEFKSVEAGTGTVMDDAFLFANCMIVLREITTAGEFCHIPQVKSVKVYTQNGDTITYDESLKSKSLVGFPFTCNFQGGRYQGLNSNWGIITIEAEGDLYGYLTIYADGSVTETPYQGDMTWDMIGSPIKTDTHEIIFPIYGEKNDEAPLQFVVSKDGSYIIQ